MWPLLWVGTCLMQQRICESVLTQLTCRQNWHLVSIPFFHNDWWKCIFGGNQLCVVSDLIFWHYYTVIFSKNDPKDNKKVVSRLLYPFMFLVLFCGTRKPLRALGRMFWKKKSKHKFWDGRNENCPCFSKFRLALNAWGVVLSTGSLVTNNRSLPACVPSIA